MISDYLNYSPLKHQIEGARYALNHHYSINGDEMGCLSGDSIIKVNRGGGSRSYRLDSLYYRFHNTWDKTIPSKVRSLKEDRIGLHTIRNVVKSGVKECLKVTLKSREIELTFDHEIYTTRGWVEAQHLRHNDSVAVDNLSKHQKKSKKVKGEKPRYNLRIVSDEYPYGHFTTINKRVRKRAEVHILTYVANLNGMGLESFIEATYREDFPKGFKLVDPSIYNIHHKDHNSKNNDISNLECLKKGEHQSLHGDYSHFGHGEIEYEGVINVQPVGHKMTYDIICDDPHRNFVANGIVVHNCGKTFEALSVACVTESPTVIVCPAYLKYTWASEIEKLVKNATFKILTPSDYNKTPTEQFLILSYSQLKHCFKAIAGRKMVIADEVHYLKNHKAQRTDLFYDVLEGLRPERFMGLSGTPVKNRVQEFWSVLGLCSFNVRGTSGIDVLDKYDYWEFCNTFCYKTTMRISGRRITKYWGLKNKELLRTLLKGKYIRRLAKDVLDLPPLIEKEVIVSYSKKDTDLAKAWEEHKAGKKGHFSSVKKESAIAKAKFTADYAKNIVEETGTPVVIFTCHPDVLPVIEQEIPKSMEYVTINANTSMEARHAAVEKFQKGQVQFLLATIGTGSTGFTMTRARNVVINDKSWVPGDNEQAIKRIHRIGQEGSCVAHYILGSMADVKICREVDEKARNLKEIL